MKTNHRLPLVALAPLLLAALACNLSPGGSPAVPVEQDETQQAPIVNTPPVTGVPAAGGCTNPYLPAIVGAAWTYQLTGPVPDTYTHTILSADEDSFIEQDAFASGVTRQGEWKCEDGALIALNPTGGNTANVSVEGVQTDFKTTALEGVTLPAAINPGDTWSQSLTLEGTQTINGTVFPARNQVSVTCTAAGTEAVTVPAGTFDALRVDCTTQMNLAMTMNGSDITSAINLATSNWYALNVGLVKSTTTGSGLDSVIELTAYRLQ